MKAIINQMMSGWKDYWVIDQNDKNMLSIKVPSISLFLIKLILLILILKGMEQGTDRFSERKGMR